MTLAATGLAFAYGGVRGARETTLTDLSLTVPAGTLTGLLGPNGSGKTTLLKLLAGILRPQRGTVTLDGQPLVALTRRQVAQRIAIVPQQTHPAFDYSVMELVLMGRHPHLGAFQLEGPQDLAIARGALAATGAVHLADRRFTTLSGGEQQRVVIAAALAQQPDILLLDEPTASLDLRAQVDVASLLAALNRSRQMTMVLATHDLNLAATVCHRLLVLRDGQLIDQGPTEEVLTASLIRRLYDIDADVRFHEVAGHLTVTPVAQLS